MSAGTPHIITQDEAKVFYEGPELCREYFRNDKMWFGTSTVQPGDTGDVDPGHAGTWEVFFCVSGEGYLDDGANEYFLKEGDAWAVPATIPHRIHNRSSAPVVMAWAGGPTLPSEK